MTYKIKRLLAAVVALSTFFAMARNLEIGLIALKGAANGGSYEGSR